MGPSSQLMIWQMLPIACTMNLPLNRNRVVEDMQNLDRMKDEFADVQIPVAVLRYVRDCVECGEVQELWCTLTAWTTTILFQLH